MKTNDKTGYEWFELELANIGTANFHLTNLPMEGSIDNEYLPMSYVSFMNRFGHTMLFRIGLGYRLIIWPPYIKGFVDSGEFLSVGYSDTTGDICFRTEDLRDGEEAFVYERDVDFPDEGWANSGMSFSDWFESRYMLERQKYSEEAWAAIVNGPPDFDSDEESVIEARRQFKWTIIEADGNEFTFSVRNASQRILNYLSLGVYINKVLVGIAHLRVHDIAPGSTKLMKEDVYGGIFDPADIEIRDMPEPKPESRDLFWEFK